MLVVRRATRTRGVNDGVCAREEVADVRGGRVEVGRGEEGSADRSLKNVATLRALTILTAETPAVTRERVSRAARTRIEPKNERKREREREKKAVRTDSIEISH